MLTVHAKSAYTDSLAICSQRLKYKWNICKYVHFICYFICYTNGVTKLLALLHISYVNYAVLDSMHAFKKKEKCDSELIVRAITVPHNYVIICHSGTKRE